MKKFLPAFIAFLVSAIFAVTPQQIFAQTSGADLVITNLQLTDAAGNIKSSFQPNEAIYYRITIANQGTQRTADRYDNRIYHTYYRHSPQAIGSCAVPSDPRNFYSYSTTNFPANSSFVYESRPGGIKEAQFPGVRSFTQSTPGTYTARAYVDYDCRAIEANDSNNQRTVSYTIVGQTLPTPTPTPVPVAVATATPVPQAPVGGTTPPSTQNPTPTGSPLVLANAGSPQEGAWIIDPEVTKIGKNASRSGMLLDWTLRDYQWAFVRQGDTNPLIPFWLVIQRIVYALFLFVIMIVAFVLIVTRGKSLSAKRFLPRFLLVILLVTFSFSLIQFLYQITDIFQGFFLRNPQGTIIQSKDLLYIGWDYRDFQGLRRFGEEFEESALMSLLFVKLTAFTYYVMAILLVVRKIILWFFIVLSPVFPLLLLFYPVRNTAKIWIGEFFRWLLYAPLFAIFLSGLVRLWQTSLPLAFNFSSAGQENEIIYPTVVGILLGGPRQNVSLLNSINVPDTFALYLVALVMLWVVIILPFILLQIFLDYMYAANFKDNPVVKQIINRVNSRFAPVTNPVLPPGTPPPGFPTGRARTIPISRHYTLPKTTGLAMDIPKGDARSIPVASPLATHRSKSQEIMRLAQVSMPTMRDIARFDTTRLSSDIRSRQEVQRMQHVLERIANPASVQSTTEREQARLIRERLVTESQKGNQVAATLLQAAQTMSSQSVSSTQASTSTTQQNNLTTLITQLANPQQVTSLVEREKITTIKERIEKEVRNGSQLASTLLQAVNSLATNSVTSLRETLSYIEKPQSVTDMKERQVYQSLREKIVTASQSGNELATLLVKSLESSTSTEQIKVIQEKLLQAQSQGSQLASEILQTVSTNIVNNVSNVTNNSRASFKEVLTKLEKPESITNSDEKQSYQQLREKVITASNSGNELATLITSALESSTSEEQIATLQEKLLTAQKEGSQLASEILQTVEKSTSTSQTSQVQMIQSKLEEAKKQGDPLAVMLLQMLATQRQATVKAPVKAVAGQKNVGFPVVNRLQQVSLDDYEAVKKLWKENYQNLEVPQSLAGERNRRQWITEDISEIEQTISLLTSANPEEVEEGMQKVSDILPFLLMGGFSQTEIIAYLKAKMEAGKGVLETITQDESEEDTLLSARRTSTTNAKAAHMTTSVEINNNYTTNTDNSSSSPVQKTEYHQVIQSPSSDTDQQNITVAPYLSQILEMANLTLPSLRDVVSYERDLQSQKNSAEITKLQSVLTHLSHPEHVTSTAERERLQVLKESLQNRSESGDTVATNLLTAASHLKDGETDNELSEEDSDLLLSLLTPENTSQENTEISQILTKAHQEGRPLAQKITNLLEKRDKQEVEQVHMFLNKIAEPEKVHTATERMQYTKLRERLGEASDNRNPLAVSILQASTNTTSQEETLLLKKQLVDAAKNNDPLASYIVTTLLSSSELLREDVKELYHELIREQKAGDTLAATILVKLRKERKRTDKRPQLMLPKQNRLQQVSLDDYEAVKNMWYDNYLHADVPPDPSGKPQTRNAWIQSDMAEITETINLLSSDNQEQQQEGMERVSTILPFLLIGGFTQQEVLGYLKAKLEAGKMALITLQNTEEEESLLSSPLKQENIKEAVQEVEIPESSEKGVGEEDVKKSVN